MKTLVVRAGALGDLLLLRGVIAGLRAAAHDVVLMAPAGPGAALVGKGPANVAALLAWDRPDLLPLHVADGHLAPALGDLLGQFDAVLAYTRNPVVIENLRRLVPRVLARDPQPPRAGPHVSAWLQEPLRNLGVPLVEVPVEPPVPEELAAAGAVAPDLPPRFLAIHMGSGSVSKNWSPLDYAGLVNALSPAAAFVLVEGPAEKGTLGELRHHPRARFASFLPPRVLGALLARAALYVGNDSGVSHLAAAWGAPSLVLFGPTDPALYSPLGPRVTVLRSPDGTMAGLRLAAVTEAALLRSGAGALPSG